MVFYLSLSPPPPLIRLTATRRVLKWTCISIFLYVLLFPIQPAKAIVGGQNLEPVNDETPYPWFASLFFSDVKYAGVPGRKHSTCGGALIGDRYVLTASHCVDGNGEKINHPEFDYRKGDLKVRLGHINRNPDNPKAGSTGIVRTVEDVWIPSGWEGSGSGGSDFAILVLSEPVTEIEPIPIAKFMPAYGSRIYTLGNGITEHHTVPGYGPRDYDTTSDRTKIASYTYISNEDCVAERKKYEAEKAGVPLDDHFYDYDESDIDDTVYCGYPYELTEEEKNNNEVKPGIVCSGDSGGPHFFIDQNNQPVLVGVSSYGPTGCFAPKYSAFLSLLPGSPSNSEDSDVKTWVETVVAGGNPFAIGAEPGETHTIYIRGPNRQPRDFRGHAGKIVGRTEEEKAGGEDHLRLGWSGSITFDIQNIDKIRMNGYYWEVPVHVQVRAPTLELEEGHFAINGIFLGDVQTENLNRASEVQEYAFIYADKTDSTDVWNKNEGSVSPINDARPWYLTEHQVRNNPTLAGVGIVLGTVTIQGGGLHTPGFRECVLMASTSQSNIRERRCISFIDTYEYDPIEENLFGTFTVQRHDDYFPSSGDIYTVEEGGALVIDIHPDGRHDQVRVVRGDAQTDGTLIVLAHGSEFGDFSFFPYLTTDADRDIEGDWSKFVFQSADTYYSSDPDSETPEGLVTSRIRLPDDPDDGAVDHIMEGIFMLHDESPYASLGGKFGTGLERERNRVLATITKESGSSFQEIDRDSYRSFLRMQPVLNGFSIDTARKTEEASVSLPVVTARFVDRQIADAQNISVNKRMLSIRNNKLFGQTQLTERYAHYGLLSFENRLEFENSDSSVGNDLVENGGWIQMLHSSGGVNTNNPLRFGSIQYRGTGFVSGFDMPITDNAFVGATGGYISANLQNELGTGGTPDFHTDKLIARSIGIYGGYQRDALYLQGELRHTKSKVKSARELDILLSGPQTAHSKFSGSHWYGSFELGYRFNTNFSLDGSNQAITVEPTAGIKFSNQSYDQFEDTGAGILNATVKPSKSKIATGSLGVRVSTISTLAAQKIRASIYADWSKEIYRKGLNSILEYEFLESEEIRSADILNGSAASFGAIGLSLELNSESPSKPSLSFSYDTKLHSHFDNTRFSAQIEWKF